MEKEIKISYKIKTKPVAENEKMCNGCALLIRGMICMNLRLCPYTETNRVNWEVVTKAEKIDE